MPTNDIFTKGDYAEFRGDPQMLSRMKRQAAIAQMTPAEKSAFDIREAETKRLDAAHRSLVSTFKNTNVATITKDKTNPNIEKLRVLSLDDDNPDQWLLFYRQIFAREIIGVPLGKFRFNWDENGKPVFVAWSEQSWINFFTNPQSGRWIPRIPITYKCPPSWDDKWAKEYFRLSQISAQKFTPINPLHVWQYKSGAAKCRRPKKSTWVRIRKGVVGAALIVAAVYLGPVILAKVKTIAGGAAGAAGESSAASAIAEATTFQKIQAGSKTLIGYVNKARTIEAVVKGELPPPPIGIPGASFRDWAFIVAKEKIQEEAIDYAMEQGQEYIAKKMSEKEEAKLRAEIAEMQRQLIAMMPPEVLKMPPEPDPELATPIKKIQVIEEKRQDDLQKFIIPGAIIAGALFFGG